MRDTTALRSAFERRFAAAPALFRAPGRVNLIGEHTDYNGGYVMPVAIGFYTYVAAAPRSDGRFVVHSNNVDQTVEFSLDQLAPGGTRAGTHWADYVSGVAGCLRDAGVRLSGANLLIDGAVPLGAGLSSSAALEVACALALSQTAGQSLDRVALARLCQRAENEYVGMRCGIMDQFASSVCRQGHALRLDCRSLAYEHLPLEASLQGRAGAGAARLVICNSLVRHQLAGGEYNTRRAQCEQAVRLLARVAPQVQSLRDLTPALLQEHGAVLDDVVRRRCRHVVTENQRVLDAGAALQAGDLARFGRLMQQSHASLREDYEVSCTELDGLVELAQGIEGTIGARMTGGGFGGCTVNLVREDAVERFCAHIAEGYTRLCGRAPEIYVCNSADGAQRLDA